MAPEIPQEPDLTLLDETLSADLIEAVKTASGKLKELGIRHMLIGGLAVGAYGHVRATKDIDFLVGDEAFQHFKHGLVSTVGGFPNRVGHYVVDALGALPGEDYIEESLDDPQVSEEVPIAPIEILIYTKLKSPRPKDAVDILELLAIGHDPRPVLRYLKEHSPDLIEKFKALIDQERRSR
jgi:hypothetical protein